VTVSQDRGLDGREIHEGLHLGSSSRKGPLFQRTGYCEEEEHGTRFHVLTDGQGTRRRYRHQDMHVQVPLPGSRDGPGKDAPSAGHYGDGARRPTIASESPRRVATIVRIQKKPPSTTCRGRP
jgi:hypothetical protein